MENLKAYAIGPDRYDVVVGNDKNSVVAWYKKLTGISEEEFEEYDVSEFPMDKESENGRYEITTLRKFISDVTEFP